MPEQNVKMKIDGWGIAKLVLGVGVGLCAGVVTNMALSPIIGMSEGAKKAVAFIGAVGIAGAVGDAAENYMNKTVDAVYVITHPEAVKAAMKNM